ncbi:UNVERIFIED_CONTAM: phosphoenolpyruvate carboxykinase (ATP), partial [Salmonella enterica subsp. enterica serovar Weltevreden]
PYFGLKFPKSCPGVPTEILEPKNAWADKDAFNNTAQNLAGQFIKNFEQYASAANDEIMSAAPKVVAQTTA